MERQLDKVQWGGLMQQLYSTARPVCVCHAGKKGCKEAGKGVNREPKGTSWVQRSGLEGTPCGAEQDAPPELRPGQPGPRKKAVKRGRSTGSRGGTKERYCTVSLPQQGRGEGRQARRGRQRESTVLLPAVWTRRRLACYSRRCDERFLKGGLGQGRFGVPQAPQARRDEAQRAGSAIAHGRVQRGQRNWSDTPTWSYGGGDV